MLCEFTVSQPYFTNTPEDRIVNTFHYFWDDVTPPVTQDFTNVKNELFAAYALIFSSATLAGRAPWAPSTGWTVKAYDLAQPKPRVPIYSVTEYPVLTMASASSTMNSVSGRGMRTSGVTRKSSPQNSREPMM